MEMIQSFTHSLKTMCENMRAAAGLLRSMAMGLPTETARNLLGDQLLFSKAGSGILEVWKCLAVEGTDITVVEQKNQCTEEIPVNFTFYNKTQQGYLDPLTLVISHNGHPADCGLVATTPLQLYNSTYSYQRSSGTLIKTASLADLKVLNYNWNSFQGELLSPRIYTPVLMYSWEEMRPSKDLNAILHTTAAQAEVLSLLGAQFEASDSASDCGRSVQVHRSEGTHFPCTTASRSIPLMGVPDMCYSHYAHAI